MAGNVGDKCEDCKHRDTNDHQCPYDDCRSKSGGIMFDRPTRWEKCERKS